MGRKKDLENAALIKELGLEGSSHHYSKKELLAMKEARRKEAEDLKRKEEALNLLVGSDDKDVDLSEAPLPRRIDQLDNYVDDEGLTDRQRLIIRMRMRGLSQTAIANFFGISQPMVHKELAAIKQWQIDKGKQVKQDEIVGTTTSVYEEIEYRGWELFHESQEVADKAKALAVVMSAREKHTKLLMDLGLLKKAQQEVKHKIEVSPFLEKWNDSQAKKELGDVIVARQLTDLAEPTPDEEYDDAILVDEPTVQIDEEDD